MITIFAHIRETQNPFYDEIDNVLLSFKDGSNREKIERIRTIKDKAQRNKEKAKLKSVCFSGKFAKRSAMNIIEHSGYCTLDFDDVEKPAELRDSLKSNEYVYSGFISPSGNGVKAIVRIPAEIENHKKYYEALAELFDNKIDEITKDVSRVCYESYDPDLFINHDAKVWTLKKEYTEVNLNNTFPRRFQITKPETKIDVILSWWNKKFTLNVGERNSNLFKLAASLNKAGMDKDRCLSLFYTQYHSGLPESELESIVKSAYKKTSEFNTLVLIDDRKVYETQKVLKKGVQRAKTHFKNEGFTDDDIEEVLAYDFEDDFLIFWNTDKNGKLSMNDFKFKLFLENRGFYKVQLNEREYTFVKVYNNIIREVNEVFIKDFVLSHVLEVDMNVYNFFARSTAKFSEIYLNLLETKELAMIRDTSDTSYLFFQNGVLKITKDNTELIDYINIGGFVWEKNIIPHKFEFSKDKSDFQTFISNISQKDEKRTLTLEVAMGYLMNTFKKGNEGLAIILYDETLNDNPSGRTGKTLISKAIGHVRKLVTLNGKEFDNKGQFPYQTVNLDDNVICFDDMERRFKFETLFSIITGNLTLNKKNLQPIEIPFSESPKILFTSNYILSGEGDSHDARKLEIELYRHYSKIHQPINEFGKLFFTEWDVKEWDAFYSYMISNIQKYFNHGLIFSELTTGKAKKLIANTCEDFVDWCENDFLWADNVEYKTKEILNKYNDGSHEMPRNMNVSWFGRWLSVYFEFKKWKREDVRFNGVRYFTLSGTNNEQTKEEDDGLPF